MVDDVGALVDDVGVGSFDLDSEPFDSAFLFNGIDAG